MHYNMLKLRQHQQMHNYTIYIFFLLLSCYMFRHYRQLQEAHTKISLKHSSNYLVLFELNFGVSSLKMAIMPEHVAAK